MRQKGILTLTNPTSDVSFSITALRVYNIFASCQHCTPSASNPSTILQGSTATMVFTASSGYKMPSTAPTISTASVVSWTVSTTSTTDDTGTLILSNPTGDVSFTITAVSAMPVKGQIITMNLGNATPAAGTNNQYRIMNIDGNIAFVVALYQPLSMVYNSENTYSYSGTAVDTYLNNTWYNSLNSTAKSAIVDTQINHYFFKYSSQYSADTHPAYIEWPTGRETEESGISRKVFILSVQDILDYFGNTFSSTQLRDLLPNSQSNNLRDGQIDYGSRRINYCSQYQGGRLAWGLIPSAAYINPAFQIDLSKISWS